MLDSKLNTTPNKLNFESELARFGPNQSVRLSLPEARKYCSRWANSHYENFLVATLLLPRTLRQDFHIIYAYCRWSDNLADEIADRQHSLQLLDWWEGELAECGNGHPRHPVLMALQETVHQHSLTLTPFTDLLSAFRQDQTVVRYQDNAELLDYCRRSANPVGRILLELAGSANELTQSLSDKVCTGLQLANFCQDLSRDAGMGRIYAPAVLWQRHGVSENMVLKQAATQELRAMLAEWVAEARNLLHEGWPLVEHVPRWLRIDVDLFVRGGLAILDAIRRQDFDVWSTRPQVTNWTQAKLLASSILTNSRFARPFLRRFTSEQSPVPATQLELKTHG